MSHLGEGRLGGGYSMGGGLSGGGGKVAGLHVHIAQVSEKSLHAPRLHAAYGIAAAACQHGRVIVYPMPTWHWEVVG